MKYFKVQIFGDEYISIDETELATAIRAQIKGTIAVLSGGTVAGNSIASITPDWNRELGYNRGYHMTPEDYRSISDKKEKEYAVFLGETKTKLLTPGQDVKQLNGNG